MIRNIIYKRLKPILSAALLGITLAGCGANSATAPKDTTTQAADDSAHQSDAASASTSGDNHDAEIEATMAKFFPGATLTKKPFPFDADNAAHLGGDGGVKFTGEEGKWQVFEAAQDGKRLGMGVMTHSALPGGQDMHVAFAVNSKFSVTHVAALDAPDNAKMQGFVKAIVGKNLKAPLKVGQDLKAPAGLTVPQAQIAADSVKKGLAILDSNFNAAHGHEAAPHDESKSHAH